ncbi:hypothetical protein [Phosphitispora sp. TUW77]|uniref:hypothetical protein n=1 Tax=Phosphitispora sp. TUW77 TaxID=3152361 RepID=UPI003AB1515A
MGGDDFAKLLMFCFDYFDDFATSIDLIKQLEIHEELIERLKVLVSKYVPMYKRIKTRNINELGWVKEKNSSEEYIIILFQKI